MSVNQDEASLVSTPRVTESSFLQMNREQIFQCLQTVAQSIVQMFGSHCEVVVHDLADPEHSIVSIAGNLTNRNVGGAITDLGLAILQSGSSDEGILTYETQSPGGQRMKSTSALLRDQDGRLFGALCINLDVEALSQTANLLTEMAQTPLINQGLVEHFADEPAEVITGIMQEEVAKLGLTAKLTALKREQRKEIVYALQERGAFHMRNAPTIVAQLLGVSRFTIYNYLNEGRARNAASTDQ